MAVTETAAFGTKLSLGSVATTPVYTEIKGVHNGPNGPSRKMEILQARHHGRTGTLKRASFSDEGQVQFDLYYDSADTTHAALLTAYAAKQVRKFKMELTDTGAEVYTFDAIIASIQGNFQVEGWNVQSVVLEITGDITVT